MVIISFALITDLLPTQHEIVIVIGGKVFADFFLKFFFHTKIIWWKLTSTREMNNEMNKVFFPSSLLRERETFITMRFCLYFVSSYFVQTFVPLLKSDYNSLSSSLSK